MFVKISIDLGFLSRFSFVISTNGALVVQIVWWFRRQLLPLHREIMEVYI